MAKYILANNAKAKLDGAINDSITSITLKELSATMSSALSNVIFSESHILLTLTNTDESAHEIVEVTDWNSGTLIASINRAKDDSIAQSWSDESIVEIRLTKKIAKSLYLSTGDLSFATGYESIASNYCDVAMGSETVASGTDSFAMGATSQATGYASCAIGENCIASNDYAVAIGYGSKASGYGSFAIGSYLAKAAYSGAVAYGELTDSKAWCSIVLGVYNVADSNAHRSIVAGQGVWTDTTHEFAMGFDPYFDTYRGDEERPTDDTGVNIRLSYGEDEGRGWFKDKIKIGNRNSEMMEVAKTGIIDLTDGTAEYVIEIPTGAHFFPDRIDVIITTVDTPGGSPTIQVGTNNSGAEGSILAASAVTVDAAHQRQTFTPDNAHGVDTVVISVATAGSGTTYNCRVIVIGYLVKDE